MNSARIVENIYVNVTRILGLEEIRKENINHHMADKPMTSTVGRPRSRSASQTPKGTTKVGRSRSKSAQKQKLKGQVRKLLPPLREQLDQYYNLNGMQYR